MIISIASEKGGACKTTVSTNLALSLGSRGHLLNCDVEKPNAHLFFSALSASSAVKKKSGKRINNCEYMHSAGSAAIGFRQQPPVDVNHG